MNFKLSYTVSLFSMDIQKHKAVQMRLAMIDLLPSRLVRFITKVNIFLPGGGLSFQLCM